MLAQVDLETIVERCRGKSAKDFIRESVDCYRIGAYRSSVIAAWIALVYDIIDKLRELAAGGDAKAAAKIFHFDKIQQNRDTAAALEFERTVLDVAMNEFELISPQEFADLGRLFEDRNRYSHPNLNQDSDEYRASPELARLHLRQVVDHVLSRPPVQGKAALTAIQTIVDSEYFPEGVDQAAKVLTGSPLARAKGVLVREFLTGTLASIVRESLSSKKYHQRVAAVQACVRLHPEVCGNALRDKCPNIFEKTADKFYGQLAFLLYLYPDLQKFVSDSLWIRVNAYVRSAKDSEILLLPYAGHIDKFVEAAVSRLRELEKPEISRMLQSTTVAPPVSLIDECVAMYEGAASFGDANGCALQVLQPAMRYMNKEQATKVVAAGANLEVRDSFEYPPLVIKIVGAGLLTREDAKAVAQSVGSLEKLSL